MLLLSPAVLICQSDLHQLLHVTACYCRLYPTSRSVHCRSLCSPSLRQILVLKNLRLFKQTEVLYARYHSSYALPSLTKPHPGPLKDPALYRERPSLLNGYLVQPGCSEMIIILRSQLRLSACAGSLWMASLQIFFSSLHFTLLLN